MKPKFKIGDKVKFEISLDGIYYYAMILGIYEIDGFNYTIAGPNKLQEIKEQLLFKCTKEEVKKYFN